MISLRQLLLANGAAEKRVAVLVNAVAEVLALHADAGTLPPHPMKQLSLFNDLDTTAMNHEPATVVSS